MWKDKMKVLIDYMMKHSKLAFPIVVIVAVAITVFVALTASNTDKIVPETEESTVETITEETIAEESEEIVSMVLNEDPAITTLITSFYSAMTSGDEAVLNSVCDNISISDMLHYVEKSKYIEAYPVLEIYTKPGLEEGATIAFVYYKVVFAEHEEQFPGYSAYYICTNEQGELYIKRSEISEEANEYIGQLMSQDDVVEFNNRITVEYNELMEAHPELLEYLSEMDAQVNAAVGTKLADMNAQASQEQAETSEGGENTENGDAEGAGNSENTENGNAEGAGNGENTENGDAEGAGNGENTENGDAEGAGNAEQTPAENMTQYATTTTTVNLRSSDSEQADKIGKVPGGTQVQVLEQKVNGWSKVIYEEQEGFIKSEFLQNIETVENTDDVEGSTSAENTESTEGMGTVTATTNVKIRESASQSAESLGTFVGGDTAELLAKEGDWCKINYNGKVGYVKADYVQ